MKPVKIPKFYNVPKWAILIGGGLATKKAAILALIYSFSEKGTSFTGSTAYIAQVCGCSRRQVFTELEYLIAHGYIEQQKDSPTKPAQYTVNVDRCKQAAAEIERAEDADELQPESGEDCETESSTYAATSQDKFSTYAATSQELMQPLHKTYAAISQTYAATSQDTINIINNSVYNNGGKQQRGSGKAAAGTPHQESGKELTSEQLDEIRSTDFSALKRQGKDAEHYISLARQYGFAAAMRMMQQDLKKAAAEPQPEPRAAAGSPQRPANSSISPEVLQAFEDMYVNK